MKPQNKQHVAINAKIAAITIIITADHTNPAIVKHPKPKYQANFELAQQHKYIPRPKKSTDIGVTT